MDKHFNVAEYLVKRSPYMPANNGM